MAEAALIRRSLLSADDPEPVGVRNGDSESPFLLICDHAGNAVPASLGDLGLPRAELDRHIGIDIGILGVSERLSDLLDAPLVFQRYSRLVVESNRLVSSPESIIAVSDGTLVPGNQALDPAMRAARIAEIAMPYHAEIVRRIESRLAADRPVILVSMHSFTPSLLARPFARPWHVSLCFGASDSFTRLVLAALEGEADLQVGRNQPYGVDMAKDYSIPVHGEGRGLPYAEFEIRQDLIDAPAGQAVWGERIARVLGIALEDFGGGARAAG